ncbi:hypothetical protein CJU90_3732 [Yarrowia sp. C11]|nr:hypothetical protein CKK34_5342 [Yarrowia sp. E02]KAG5367436.1 hypothetical protein CJU90_3732 [Yarrowia sp. C11]
MNSPAYSETSSNYSSSPGSPVFQNNNLLPPPPSPQMNAQSFPQQLDFSLLEVAAKKAEMGIMMDDLEDLSL